MKKLGMAQSAFAFCHQKVLETYQVVCFDENSGSKTPQHIDAWIIPLFHLNDWEKAFEFAARAPVLVLLPSDKKELLKGLNNRSNIDYLFFPFGAEEFDAGIEKLLMMSESGSKQMALSIDALTMMVKRKNLMTEALTVKEFQILKWLEFRDHRGLTRTEILHRVWEGKMMSRKVVDVHLHNLRKKLSAIEVDIAYDSVNRRYRLKLE